MNTQSNTNPANAGKPEVVVDGYGGTTPAPAERGVSAGDEMESPPVVTPANRHEPEAGSPEDDATNTVSNMGPLS